MGHSKKRLKKKEKKKLEENLKYETIVEELSILFPLFH